MRYPEFLEDGGVIGFPAPSFGCSFEPYISQFKNALSTFEKMGYKVIPGPNAFLSEGVGISNSPELCAEEIISFWTNQDINILISCGGGELMCEILDYIDFDKLGCFDPKWFVGYSDNTNLTFLLTILCDTASLYASCAPTYGMMPWHKSLIDSMDFLCGKRHTFHSYDLWEKESLKSEENPLAPFHLTEQRQHYLYDGKSVINCSDTANLSYRFWGRLVGGCIDCLVNLVGTSYDRVSDFIDHYESDGIVWFLEACDLNVFGIRRAMWQLEHAGWFRNCKGLLFGRPLNGDPMFSLDIIQAVLPTAKRYDFPVLFGVDIGHCPPRMPIVSGALASVIIEGNEMEIEYILK